MVIIFSTEVYTFIDWNVRPDDWAEGVRPADWAAEVFSRTHQV